VSNFERGGTSISLYEQRWGKAFRSSSAEKVAMLRAFGALERDAAVRNPDYLAGPLAGEGAVYRLGLALAAVTPLRASARWSSELIAAGGYWGEIARVKHYDEILLGELAAGIPQVIVLGAGFDSRGYRFADRLRGVGFFEVDHPATAARKRERVKAAIGSLPPHVTYVACDLDEDDLDQALAEAGFDAELPTLVLWIGVSMYLSEEVADEVLAWAGRLAPGSSIGFDYLDRGFFEDTRRFGPAGRFRLFVSLSGERLVCGFDPGSVQAQLEERGLEVRSHLGPAEAEELYLRRSSGRTTGPLFAYWRFLHAGVPSGFD
jgi:methyltransferase (TIGR00027 family)